MVSPRLFAVAYSTHMKTQQTRREFIGLAAAAVAAPFVQRESSPRRITTLVGVVTDNVTLNNPFGLVIGPDGALYWVEYGSHRLLRMDLRSKKISVLAGTGTKGYSGDGGPATAALLNTPHELRFDSKGNIYIAERDNHTIRFIDVKSKTISTVAGTGEMGYSGDGGPAISAKFNGPKGIAYSAEGALYISDTENHVIRRIDLRNGMISTVIGTGQRGDGPDGEPLACKLARPHGVFIQGRTLYIGDSENHRIRTMQV